MRTTPANKSNKQSTNLVFSPRLTTRVDQSVLLRRVLCCITLLTLLAIAAQRVEAATYHVAPTGNDTTGDGSAGNPWATINHADFQNLLVPGDTVTVQAGTYPQASGDGVVLNNDGGTDGAPITYIASGKVVIDQSAFSGQTYGFQVQSPYIVVSGFEIRGAAHGIVFDGSLIWTGNNCIATNNVIHDSAPVDSSGVYLKNCQNASVVRNVIYNINSGVDSPWSPVGAGIRMQKGDMNNIWNNTIDNAYLGVFIYGVSFGATDLGHISTLNNIVANSRGWGFVNPWSVDQSLFTSGYNLVYNDVTTYGNYPAGNNGPLPSDVAADPKFVFQVIHDYHLLTNSPAIEAGTNVGFPFVGTAPDMGAFEGGNPPAAMGTIVGRVSAAAPGNPALAGATVQTTSGAFSTTTDASGNYLLLVPAGANSAKASGAFLSTQTLTTNVSAGGTVTLNFSLSLTNSSKTNYVNDATGDDSNPGTSALPWKTIGNGDSKGLLAPGDNVVVNAGTYAQASTNGVNLVYNSGYSFAPITYRAQGTVLIDQSSVNGASYGFKVAVKGIVVSGFEIKGAQHGVYLAPGSDFCTVDACVIHDANGTVGDASGIYVNQSANPALTRNIIYNINASGNMTWSPSGAAIRLQGGNNINVFNNTIDNAYLGIFCYGGTGLGAAPAGTMTTENNIVVNATGWGFVNPWGTDMTRFTSGYNLVFNDVVTFGNYPAGNDGPMGSDMAVDPGFVNAGVHNYALNSTSPARNMGINVGLPFTGIAPDLGALESSYNPPLATYYVNDATGNDANPGTLAQPWKTIGNGDTTGILNPGDTVMVTAGTYPQASSAGVNLIARHGVPGAQITYRANGSVLIDQSAASTPSYGFKLLAGIRLEGFEIKGAQYGIYLPSGSDSSTVDSCVVHDSNGTGGDASGIYVRKSANANLTRNVIYNINAGNTPWSPVGTGVEAQYASNLKVFNNTIDGCYVGVFFYGGGGKGSGPYGHITTENNIVANCTGWGFVNPWSTDTSLFTCGYNLIFNDVVTYGNFPAGNNDPFPSDVTTDPLFVNAPGGDFHLQAGSPAIEKGIDVGLPFPGRAPSLGAFEPLLLKITSNGTSCTISWVGTAMLQSAPVVTGTWSDMTGVTSPYSLSPVGSQKYFRLKQ
ncbi:MAG: right-handed parallel beta-helix repeat-containing protein [Verrucomicrobiota bacterium]